MKRLRIAIQKKGKLSTECFEIFKKSGMGINVNERQLIYKMPKLPIDVLLCRDDDIPTFISEEACDLGIVGENVYKEFLYTFPKFQNTLTKIEDLNFSKCRLSIATPQNMKYESISCLNNKTIATTYPNIVKEFLSTNNIAAEIFKIEGSVEAAPSLKLADAICDLVSTGSTLEMQGLIEQEVILKSQAIMIANKKILNVPELNALSHNLVRRINSVIRAKNCRYVMLNCHSEDLNSITKVLPGAESPSVINLNTKGMLAVHSLCNEPIFWDTMEKLKQAGASSILVLPIEKMLM